MNKNAIQKYAIWARNELITQIKQRAFQYGIDDKGYGEENADVIAGRVLSADEKRQRQSFIDEIKYKDFQQAVEEVAYTWFNRFVALRFMEVNDYLPTHIRVFSDSNGAFNPEILKDVLHLDLQGLDKTKVSELINANATDDLYCYLLLTQCNALNEALPEMFELMGGYTEMLLPNNILRQDSVIGRLVSDIPEEDWLDAVQIIGWMFQYYNTEPKQAVFDGLKKNIKITKEKIPAATQLFTPEWIVKYMVENSLGRLWLERHPRSELKTNWKYYIDEAEQTPDVAAELEKIRDEYKNLNPEDIKFIDPCMGSGHILVYAFEILMQIYRSAGYADRDASKLILEKNIYGLDIDPRAHQLSYFALMMKARQYNRRIFAGHIKPQVYHPTGWSDGEEYGSLMKVAELEPRLEIDDTDHVNRYLLDDDQLCTSSFRWLLEQKYDVVVTNPPYMSNSGMNDRFAKFLKEYYPDSKSDASTAFMEQAIFFCKASGFMSMINIPVWMFISSYEKLRLKILGQNTISSMLHFGRGIFGSDFGSTGFVIRKNHIKNYMGSYRRLFEKQGAVDSIEQKEKWFLEGMGVYTATADNFSKIPGSPVAYWVSNNFIQNFIIGLSVAELSDFTGSQHKTAENEKFLRLFWEISNECIYKRKWVFYAKGGVYRKWYGNMELVVDWSIHAQKFYCSNKTSNMLAEKYRFQEGITYTSLSSSANSFRYLPPVTIFDIKGPSLVKVKHLYYILALLNSIISQLYLKTLNSTMTLQVCDVKAFPIILEESKVNDVEDYSLVNVNLSRIDWNSFETSWDFKRHPLVPEISEHICL